MTNCRAYFNLAQSEERSGNLSSALLFYISSFCAFYNSSSGHPIGAVSKIRLLQRLIGLSDAELCKMVRSYGPLSDEQCQQLLYFSIYGYVDGIHAVLNHG